MSSTPSRPKHGIGPDAALKRWSEAADYSELVSLSGQSNPPAVEDAHKFIREIATENAYKQKREALETAFRQKLIDIELAASGISNWIGRREVIDPSTWEIVQIDYGLFGDAVGENIKYEKLEFFEPSAIPLNVRLIPEWLAQPQPSLETAQLIADDAYEHVTFKGIRFTFGPIQAKVVKLLHEASKAGQWSSGKMILGKAGAGTTRMHDAFKSQLRWRELVDSDGRGKYRISD
jgi:hypothetical protein